jgi:outer membrane protein
MGRTIRIGRATFGGIAVIVLLVGVLGWNIYQLNAQPKMGFVKGTELFEGFKGKKELEAKFTKSEADQQSMLDTLTLEIADLTNQLTERPNNKDLQAQKGQKQQLHRELQQRFSQKNMAQNQQYSESIWKQINQYTLEYGKQNGYDYIFGATGNGSLMYAKDAKDITKEVLKFINKKYEGL